MKNTLSLHKYAVLIFCMALLLFGCGKAKVETPKEDEFEKMMGKGLPAWQYVQTREDYENLTLFRTLFEKNISFVKEPLAKQKTQQTKIPKVIHFIWIGPKNFPTESVENVKSWIAKNPDWTVKFWTDRQRPLPHPAMQLQLVQNFHFTALKKYYDLSDNFAEKSDLLRLEILLQEGGVYVDHDVKCFASFDSLNAAYDLYCGLELPSQTPLSSSIHTTNNLVGSRPDHPVLKHCITWIENHWDEIERAYPGKDKESVIQRIAHRTFYAFGEAVKSKAGQGNMRDIVFPAFYFNAPNDRLALLARHLYAGTWFENESVFEKMTRERLMLISKKTNKILLYFGLATGLNLIGFAALFILFRKRTKMIK
jgi:hypothetical protein